MTKKKMIKLKHGGIAILMKDQGVCRTTVERALRYFSDTEVQERIRKRAKELKLVRSF